MTVCSRLNVIANPRNVRIREVLRLLERSERRRTGRYIAEGIRSVARASERSGLIETLIVAPAYLTIPFGQALARRLAAGGVATLEVSPDVYRLLARSDEPQGLAAVVRQQWASLDEVVPSGPACWLAVERVRSPGNLGSVLRTAEAVGVAGVILLGTAGDRADPYDPAAVRSSMGAVAALRFVEASGRELAGWARRHGCLVVGASSGALDYLAVSYPDRVVVMVGNERRGLAAEHRAICDRLVGIPMVGRGDSLNLAVAAGVVLYEVFNQRRRTADGAACRASDVKGQAWTARRSGRSPPTSGKSPTGAARRRRNSTATSATCAPRGRSTSSPNSW
jgi:TrmH family RNA methyltransferase